MNRPGLAAAWIVGWIVATPAGAPREEGTKPPPAGPIDFAGVPRTIGGLPELAGPQPLYGLFLFGRSGETRVWAVLDSTDAKARAYDVLHLDLNADGDLTGEGERFAGKVESARGETSCRFTIGRFVQPGTPAEAPRVHTDFSVTWTPDRVGYRMNWDGGAVTMGAYGPDGETYGTFSARPETAPIFVPGHDHPFQFETWLSRSLRRGRDNEFRVFVGNRGSVTGAFTCVDDRFLRPDEYVIATLLYKDRTSRERSVRYELRERC